MRVVGRTLAGIAATVALAACSPGYREAAPAPPPPSAPASSSPAYELAEEDALRAAISWPPDEIRGALERRAVPPGGRLRVTGSATCTALVAYLELPAGAGPPIELTVSASSSGAFTVDGTVPRDTRPQEARVAIGTTCGPAEAAAFLTLPLRVTA